MLDNENNSSELSNEPITQDAGIEAIMGMVNPKEDLGEIENELFSAFITFFGFNFF